MNAVVGPATFAAVLLAGPGIGLLVALARQRGWHRAAAAVDTHYRLKDRTATALDFLARKQATPAQQLQIEDAVAHLDAVEPREVVPFRLPRPHLALHRPRHPGRCRRAHGDSDVDAAGEGWPGEGRPVIVGEAEEVAESLKQLDELAKNEKTPKLGEACRAAPKKVEEMKQPGVDDREARRSSPRCRPRSGQQQAQYNIGLVDGQLRRSAKRRARPTRGTPPVRCFRRPSTTRPPRSWRRWRPAPGAQGERRPLEEKLKQVAEGWATSASAR